MSRFKNWLAKIRGLRKRKGLPEDAIAIPESWPTKRPGEDAESSTKYVLVDGQKKPFKIRVPGLRTGKRIIAAILIVFNFFISQVTLMGRSETLPLAVFFFLNTFILVDYLWKTRTKQKIEE